MTATRIKQIRAMAEQHLGKRQSAALLVECLDEIEALQRKFYNRTQPTLAPSLSQSIFYGGEIGLSQDDSTTFHDYHTARGWRMGKTGAAPMLDWKAAMRLWRRNQRTPESASEPAGWTEFAKTAGYSGQFRHAPEYLKLDFAKARKRAAA